MNRRQFLQQGGRALAATPFCTLAAGLLPAPSPKLARRPSPPGILKRIGITTVCLREMFPKRLGLPGVKGPGGTLTLMEAPKFIADNIGLPQRRDVEHAVRRHLDGLTAGSSRRRPTPSARSSSTSSSTWARPTTCRIPDPAKRAATVTAVKGWMDAAAAIGATSLRANTGAGPASAWDPKRTAEGFRQLARVRPGHRGHDPGREPHRLQRGHRQGRRGRQGRQPPELPRDLRLGEHAGERDTAAENRGAEQAVPVPAPACRRRNWTSTPRTTTSATTSCPSSRPPKRPVSKGSTRSSSIRTSSRRTTWWPPRRIWSRRWRPTSRPDPASRPVEPAEGVNASGGGGVIPAPPRRKARAPVRPEPGGGFS